MPFLHQGLLSTRFARRNGVRPRFFEKILFANGKQSDPRKSAASVEISVLFAEGVNTYETIN